MKALWALFAPSPPPPPPPSVLESLCSATESVLVVVRAALDQGVVLDSGHGFVAVPAWVLQLALCVGVCVNVAVLVSIFFGRLCLFRGNMVNGRWRSDHLSCRSLAWWELWVICPKRGVSYPGDAKPLKLRQAHLGSWQKQQAKVAKGWRYVGAAESHSLTNQRMRSEFAFAGPLTGEAAGRQTWVLDDREQDEVPAFDASQNPNGSDLVFRSQRIKAWKRAGKPTPNEARKPGTPSEAATKGVAFYQMLLCDDGHFAGDYGGPMFLMPGLIIACYVCGVDLGSRKAAMIAYLRNHQQTDGGWGTHIESPSTMFGSVLSYVSLRLLGVSALDPAVAAGRAFLHRHGGALTAPSWAKFWLCVLGVHEWEGINSIPAEMWLLPFWFPFHPGKLWCHCRMVYLPMCYLYCKRFRNPAKATDQVLIALRKELYVGDYCEIKWDAYRHVVCPLDEYSPVTTLQKFLHNVLAVFETYTRAVFCWPLSLLRAAGIKYAMEYMKSEDIQTNWICIGPVNKVLNMLCVWVDNGLAPSDSFYKHVARLDDYLWVAEDGMKMQGYNGSQCWDTSFAIQAVVEGGMGAEFPDLCDRVYGFLERTQILSTEVSQATEAHAYEHVDLRKQYYRHVSKGGWPFSTSAHGWPISDCSSEGLKAVLCLHSLPAVAERKGVVISADRLYDCVNVLLTYQNADGGWATYENNRGFGFYEWMNPSEVFGDIMIDYSYVECSSASMTALAAFSRQYPQHRPDEIAAALRRGRHFIRAIQRPDGSWYGSWGVCFTYATWFGIEALVAAGVASDDTAIRRAVAFVLSKQNSNGGWGESYRSCVDKFYDGRADASFGAGGSGVVQTAWALLALMAAEVTEPSEVQAVERGCKFLMSRQLANGDFPQEGITGVFNRSCGITYTSYRNTFPIWALGQHAKWRRHVDSVEA